MALALATALPVVGCAALLAYQFVVESSRLTKAEYEDRLRLMRNATELRVANIIEDLQVLLSHLHLRQAILPGLESMRAGPLS